MPTFTRQEKERDFRKSLTCKWKSGHKMYPGDWEWSNKVTMQEHRGPRKGVFVWETAPLVSRHRTPCRPTQGVGVREGRIWVFRS